MAAQPEHAIPLFIFAQADGCSNDFTVPHWINYSYYTCREQLDTQILGNFAPWCDVPLHLKVATALPVDDMIPPFLPNEALSLIDYVEYDDQTFRPPMTHVRSLQRVVKSSLRRRRRCKRLTPNAMETIASNCNRCLFHILSLIHI